MNDDIAKIIGKVNPKGYATNGKELLAKYGSPDKIPLEEVIPEPGSKHTLVYDSSSESLEPVYFFILDLMNDQKLDPEKLIDNFTSSPGSGHFAELGQRAAVMQQQGTKLLGDINTVLRSVLNIVYDLKEFRIRLNQYSDLTTDKKIAALLSLKQIWLDKVDFQKGNSSVKAMALGQAGFQTLLDAFLFVNDLKDVDKVDLNERVKRILRARILEFNDWLLNSEKELRKRYEIERNYLKSQVNSMKLYSRWARPYLKAASELEMTEKTREPALVKTFNTILLELTLLGKKKINVEDEALSGTFPKGFEKLKTRNYYSCVLVNFRFRGIPQKVIQQSHYVFGGRADITFSSYVLNEDELNKFEEELESSDMAEVLKLIEGSTGDSLKQIQDEINFFLEEEEKESTSKRDDGSNPFRALIGGYNKKEGKAKGKEKEEKKAIVIGVESYAEKEHIRPLAKKRAEETTFNLFDIYKKSHGMVSYT